MKPQYKTVYRVESIFIECHCILSPYVQTRMSMRGPRVSVSVRASCLCATTASTSIEMATAGFTADSSANGAAIGSVLVGQVIKLLYSSCLYRSTTTSGCVFTIVRVHL